METLGRLKVGSILNPNLFEDLIRKRQQDKPALTYKPRKYFPDIDVEIVGSSVVVSNSR